MIAGELFDFVGLAGAKGIARVTPAVRPQRGLAIRFSVLVPIGVSRRHYDLTRARMADIHARLEAQRGA